MMMHGQFLHPSSPLPLIGGAIRFAAPVLLGPNSIENFWLEFWLEKSLEFWLEIPYTKKNVQKWVV